MKKIHVIIEYVGNNPFEDTFPGGITFQAIKVQAMHKFGIEQSAESKYVLQFNGVDASDQAHLSSLATDPVKLTLILKEEVPKG